MKRWEEPREADQVCKQSIRLVILVDIVIRHARLLYCIPGGYVDAVQILQTSVYLSGLQVLTRWCRENNPETEEKKGGRDRRRMCKQERSGRLLDLP